MKNIFKVLLVSFVLSTLAASSLFATSYDFKEITPDVQKAIKGRQSRYQEIQSLKKSGVIGEDNQGYVAVVKSGQASSLISAENEDRKTIYTALASQNNLGSQGIAQVQKAFAEVQYDKASSGEMVQSADGAWKKK